MPAIIDSAPDCITSGAGTEAARVEDSADFVIGNNFQDCAGFMTFGPGSTYGPDGQGAETLYMILTWAGIAVRVPPSMSGTRMDFPDGSRQVSAADLNPSAAITGFSPGLAMTKTLPVFQLEMKSLP